MNNIASYINGLQHIGVPTGDFAATVAFYESLGFEIKYQTVNNGDQVAFLGRGTCVIETYEYSDPANANGAVDHIALDVTDIQAVYDELTARGHQALEGSIQSLPFWANGVKYFTILGPNHEKVEFSQYL